MIEKNLKHYLSSPEKPLRRVLSDLYRSGAGISLVVDTHKKLLGILTITDLKQALLQGVDPDTSIRAIVNTKFVSAPVGTSLRKLRKLAKGDTPYHTGRLEKIPIVDEAGCIKALYILKDAEPLQKHAVLVTGGAGYIGSQVCRQLLSKGYSVVVLDKLLFGDAGIRDLKRHKNFKLIKGDVADITTLIRAVQNVDAIIHLAGIVGDPASALNPVHTLEQNHFATKALVDVSKFYQVARFIFASSCSVYGANPGLLTEKSKLNPVSLYAKSKCYSEQVLLSEADETFHPIIFRFGTIYGLSSRMRFDLVANTMTAHAYAVNRITVSGGAQWRPLLHVEDAASACVSALEAPLPNVAGEVFNVGDTKENYRILDIAQEVQKHFPSARIEQIKTVRDQRDYRVSFAKIHNRLGWRASRSLSESIAEIARALRKGRFPNWKNKKYSNYLTLQSVLEKMS